MEQSGGIGAIGGTGLAGRYATALFDLARDERQIDAVSQSLAALTRGLEGSPDLAALVASPILSRVEGERGILAAAGSMGLDPVTTNFLGVLARNRRLAQLPAIIRVFGRLAARHRGELTAEVTSAHPLAADQVDALRRTLRARYGTDVALDAHVDPVILGGLIVKIGSQMIDGSIRTKLNSLAQAMRGS